MQKEYNESEHLSFKDDSNQKHGLRGVIQIYRKNKETGEVSFWDESTNIIPISGYQFVLMKLFGLFLDSSHGKVTDNLTRDTNLAMPDLNERLKIGVKPENYMVMDDDIAMESFCQGFMIGNGGAGEDSVTTKNTAYSFISLRNPIPFQQELNLNPSIAGKYLGLYHGVEDDSSGKIPQSAYIKKFDERPHIYHSWWQDGQRWDYIDPVTQDYLGPSATAGTPKTDRIETYVECKLSLTDTDCQQYFNHVGNTQTRAINELGLVAFDTIPGQRSVLETLYTKRIVPMLELLYKKDKTTEERITLVHLIKEVAEGLRPFEEEDGVLPVDPPNLFNFYNWTNSVAGNIDAEMDSDALEEQFEILISAYKYDGINPQALYNQDGKLLYVEDDFMKWLEDTSMAELTVDEAQRIKLITYYTFNSIPISENWEILINYRIYAN